MPPPLPPRARFGDATPPAIFPPVFGALGLGVAWRRAAEVFGVPAGFADLLLGAMTLLFSFCALAYALKVLRRPGVVRDDLAVLPGRAGLAAMVLSVYVIATALAPLVPGLATAVLGAGLALNAGLVVLVLWVMVAGPPEQRRVTPVWHLLFVGFIVGAVPALALGHAGLASAILHATGVVAVAIWAASLVQFARSDVPAPLRPLLAIHLAPASLLGTVAILSGATAIAWAATAAAVLIAAGLVLRLPWLLRAGFSPLWGALTFPLAAFASVLLAMEAAGQGAAFGIAGGLSLVAATLAIPPILVKVMQAWARGTLGARTNAARV